MALKRHRATKRLSDTLTTGNPNLDPSIPVTNAIEAVNIQQLANYPQTYIGTC